MDGKVVVITGGNSGIGLEAAVQLTDLGAEVTITARDLDKGRAAVAEVERRAGTAPHLVALDLADLDSVRDCAVELLESVARLDVLVCNAGLTLSTRAETAQGFEYLFGVNHLGHMHLVQLLRGRLVQSAPSRVVVVSSDAHRVAYRGLAFDDLQSTKRYVSWDVYAKSKLANIMFTRALSRRLEGTGVTANAVHPGLVRTNFGGEGDTRITQQLVRMLPRRFAIGPADGADTIVHLASSPDVADLSGGYYVNRTLTEPSSHARNDQASEWLWLISERLLADAGGITDAT